MITSLKIVLLLTALSLPGQVFAEWKLNIELAPQTRPCLIRLERELSRLVRSGGLEPADKGEWLLRIESPFLMYSDRISMLVEFWKPGSFARKSFSISVERDTFHQKTERERFPASHAGDAAGVLYRVLLAEAGLTGGEVIPGGYCSKDFLLTRPLLVEVEE